MASTTALFTGLSGLTTNSRRLDVIGNNISNVNTNAFKSSRIQFTPTFARNFSLGTGPNAQTGGSNPTQIGLGSTISGTQRNFNNGAISPTGVASDVAIEGAGMFIVEFAGERFYTRDGSFQQNEANDLVTLNGARVMGFGVDANFQVVSGNLQPINIPIGVQTITEATRNVTFNGNVNAAGDVASTGSSHESRAFHLDNTLTSAVASANFDLTVPGNDLYIDDGAGGAFLAFEGGAGTVITVSGVEKGGKDLGEHSFAFSATEVPGVDDFGTTIQDYMDFLNDIFGLDNSVVNGQQLGGTVELVNGAIVVTGNEGEVQNLTIDSANFVATNNGAAVGQPMVMSRTAEADGESVRTSFVVYDSLGTPLTVDLTFVLQETSADEGTTWQWLAESAETDTLDRAVGFGSVEFDANGNFQFSSNETFSIVRENGAVSPLTINMEFNTATDSITALTDTSSTLAAVFQDGSAIGTLSSYSIGEDGSITGSFTNGLSRTIGQIALAKFTNPEGLVDTGGNMFRIGPNSGEAIIASPLEFGTGRVLGGALELSNVDLSQEFIGMILASTGYSAASRVITTTDELIEQLLVLGR